MLVLSRKINERITIGDTICITVVAIKGNQVRIGIEAPPVVRIFRNELLSGRDGAAGEPAAGCATERTAVGVSF